MGEDPHRRHPPTAGGRRLSPAPSTSSAAGPTELRRLARLLGVQTSYRDAAGVRRRASPQTLLAMVRALGAHVDGPADVAAALRDRARADWERVMEPVVVAWDGRLVPVRLRLPAGPAGRRIRWHLTLEDGTERDVTGLLSGGGGSRPSVRTMGGRDVDGRAHVELEVVASPDLVLPPGYHRLAGRTAGAAWSAVVISAPTRARRASERAWGVFLPLYGLRSERSWGLGDLTDLGDLLEWVAGLGGSLVATLPMLSAFLDEPFEPSPYSPASRLFWNELFLDVEAVPEVTRSPASRMLIRSAEHRRRLAELRGAPLTDYLSAAEAKRGVLDAAARSFFQEGSSSPRWGRYLAFLRATPAARDYADFMAACARHRAPWNEWPEAEREGHLPRDGGSPDAARYHRFVQWQIAEQMAATAARAQARGAGLYFDFPLGVHSAGYDVWRERTAFALDASAGAPPDPFFTLGQDWGVNPLHPDGIREQGYGYFVRCLRHMLRHAGVLRLDHVMGLHRLWWVPRGMDARDGAYVRYRPEEFYAILALESARSGTAIVGEDLGTVPHAVRRSMARHGIHRTYVLQYEVRDDPVRPLRAPPELAMAGVNTHDMPPFAAFLRGDDLAYRLEQGWIDPAGAAEEAAWRQRVREALAAFLRAEGFLGGSSRPAVRDILTACLSWLAAGPARMVVVNLEDLWLERRPQNIPGTTDQYPNWRSPARYRLEAFRKLPQVTGTLRRIDLLRRRGGEPMTRGR